LGPSADRRGNAAGKAWCDSRGRANRETGRQPRRRQRRNRRSNAAGKAWCDSCRRANREAGRQPRRRQRRNRRSNAAGKAWCDSRGRANREAGRQPRRRQRRNRRGNAAGKAWCDSRGRANRKARHHSRWWPNREAGHEPLRRPLRPHHTRETRTEVREQTADRRYYARWRESDVGRKVEPALLVLGVDQARFTITHLVEFVSPSTTRRDHRRHGDVKAGAFLGPLVDGLVALRGVELECPLRRAGEPHRPVFALAKEPQSAVRFATCRNGKG
jgi:hypothetical protein